MMLPQEAQVGASSKAYIDLMSSTAELLDDFETEAPDEDVAAVSSVTCTPILAWSSLVRNLDASHRKM